MNLSLESFTPSMTDMFTRQCPTRISKTIRHQWTLSHPRRKSVYMMNTWRNNAKKQKPCIMVAKFLLINFKQGFKSPLSHIMKGMLSLVRWKWSFISKNTVLIPSLSRKRRIKLSIPLTQGSLLGILATCLRQLMLPNKMYSRRNLLANYPQVHKIFLHAIWHVIPADDTSRSWSVQASSCCHSHLFQGCHWLVARPWW